MFLRTYCRKNIAVKFPDLVGSLSLLRISPEFNVNSPDFHSNARIGIAVKKIWKNCSKNEWSHFFLFEDALIFNGKKMKSFFLEKWLYTS